MRITNPHATRLPRAPAVTMTTYRDVADLLYHQDRIAGIAAELGHGIAYCSGGMLALLTLSEHWFYKNRVAQKKRFVHLEICLFVRLLELAHLRTIYFALYMRRLLLTYVFGVCTQINRRKHRCVIQTSDYSRERYWCNMRRIQAVYYVLVGCSRLQQQCGRVDYRGPDAACPSIVSHVVTTRVPRKRNRKAQLRSIAVEFDTQDQSVGIW